MMKDEERNKVKYELWLAELRISSRKKCLLRQHMKTAENVYYIEETEISEIGFLTETEKNTIRHAQKEKKPGEKKAEE